MTAAGLLAYCSSTYSIIVTDRLIAFNTHQLELELSTVPSKIPDTRMHSSGSLCVKFP